MSFVANDIRREKIFFIIIIQHKLEREEKIC